MLYLIAVSVVAGQYLYVSGSVSKCPCPFAALINMIISCFGVAGARSVIRSGFRVLPLRSIEIEAH